MKTSAKPGKVNVTRMMQDIQRSTQGGEVRVTLSNVGIILAHAFRSLADAERLVIADVKVSKPRADYDFAKAVDRLLMQAVAYGSGKTVEAALEDLKGRMAGGPG